MPISLRGHNPLTFVGVGRPPDLQPTPAQTESNIRHLVWEITWYGVLIGTTINFIQLYVVRLGAPSMLVSAVTFGPALVGIFWQLPASQLINRVGRRMRWVLGTMFLHRVIYLVIALLPFALQERLAGLTVALLVVQAVPLSVAATSFLSMLADAVPAGRLAQVVGWRMAGLGLTSTVSTLGAGWVLQWLQFPGNYQVLFAIGFLCSMVSEWLVTMVQVPDRDPDRRAHDPWYRALGEMLRYPGFGHYVVSVGVLQMAFGMVAPLLPLFWARSLGATDGQISIIVTTASAAMVVGSLLMRRVTRRIGRERALAAGALGYALYPLLTSLSPGIWWLVPWAALGGLFIAAILVSQFDNLVSTTPEKDRTSYIAVYNISLNIALVAGPLLAGVLARESSGLITGLRLAAGLAVLSGLLFALRRPRYAGS
jgi:MFS family permease